MNLKPKLNLNQIQDFVLTPQLKTAIEILQYNSFELKEFINKEI